MAGNRLRERALAGQAAFGGWCSTPSAFHCELYAHDDYDYVGIDCQHGLVGDDTLAPMLQALRFAEATPVVRVPQDAPAAIGRALDLGATAVVVPMVESGAQAERAVAACRYPPEGERSWGPIRARMLLGEDPARVNAEVLCIVMVETTRGLAHVEEICATPGLDGVYVGPSDLAVSLGVPLGRMFEDDTHLAAIEKIRTACADAGVIAGIHCRDGAHARSMADAGFSMCTVGTDAALFQRTLQRELAAARGK